MPKRHGSFSGVYSHTVELEGFYKKQDVFSSLIPSILGFKGFKIGDSIQTRLETVINKIGFGVELIRMNSFHSNKGLTSAISKDIELGRLYDKVGENEKICVLIKGENSLDLRKIGEYITYYWSKDKLWDRFDIVIRADLSLLPSKEYTLRELLFVSIGTASTKITLDEIDKILASDTIKTLIIFNGYQSISHLLHLDGYAYINNILDSAKKHNLIVTTKNYVAEEAETLLKPDIILEDNGFNSERDIKKYLEKNLQPNQYQKLTSLFEHHKEFYEISKSPSMLEMLCYIAKEEKSSGLKNSQEVNAITAVYYDMISLLGTKYAEKHKLTGEVFAYPIVKFMQELAYRSPSDSNVISEQLFLDVMSSYRESILKGLPEGSDPVELVKEFGLIIEDPASAALDKKYIFTSFAFHELLGSYYLKSLLASQDEKERKQAESFISLNCDKKKYLQVMKFISGLISIERDAETRKRLMKYFWDAITLSNEQILKIGGDEQIILMMHLLSQSTKNEEYGERAPVTDYLDSNIIKNIDKWGSELVKSQYLSSTVIRELSNKLQGSKIEFIQAAKVLTHLRINDETQRKEIARILLNKMQGTDIEIVEKAMHSLQLMLDLPEVKTFFSDALGDRRVNVVLIAMEVVGKFGDEIFVESLLDKLSDDNNLIVIGAIEALKNLNHLKSKQERIQGHLSKAFGNQKFHSEAMMLRIKECLKYYPGIISIDSIVHDMLTEYAVFASVINWGKNYSERVDIIKALGVFYKEIKNQEYKDKIYSLLEKSIKSRSEEVRCAVIEAFSKIFLYLGDKKEEVFDLLHTSFSKSEFLSVKYLAFEALGLIKIDGKERVYKEIIDSISKVISKESNGEFVINAIKALLNHHSPEVSDGMQNILKIDYVDEDVKVASIEEVGEIFGKFDQTSWVPLLENVIYKELDGQSSEKVKITAIITLAKIHPYVKVTQDEKIKSYLQHFLSDGSSKLIKEAALSSFTKIDSSFKIELLPAKEAKAKAKAKEIKTIMTLAKKYANHSQAISLVDKVILNNLFGDTLSLALSANSAVIKEELYYLLSKTGITDPQILEYVDLELSKYVLLEEKYRIIAQLKEVFSSEAINEGLKNRFDALQEENRIDRNFESLEAILADKEGFADFIVINNIDVQITENKIVFLDKEYDLSDSENIELQLLRAKEIFIPMAKKKGVTAPLFEKQIEHVFYSVMKKHLHHDKAQLSVLHQTNNENSFIEVILIIEQATIFGDVLIKKINVIDGGLEVSVYRSIDNDHRLNIFGGPNDFNKYHIKFKEIEVQDENPLGVNNVISLFKRLYIGVNKQNSLGINNVIRFFKGLFKNANPLNSDYKSLFEALKISFLNRDEQNEMLVVSHNQLIGHDEIRTLLIQLGHDVRGLESRTESLERLSQAFQQKFETFGMEIESLRAQDEIESSSLNQYQKAAYKTIVHGLNGIYMASVVSGELGIAKTGLLGSVGKFCSKVSSHVPLVGIAVDFLGSIASAVDKTMQNKMAKNIAKLAVGPVDADKFIKKLALEIVQGELKEFETKEDIAETIASFFDYAANTKAKVIGLVVSSVSDYFEGEESLHDEVVKGEKNGQLITKILVGYIAAGKCKSREDGYIDYNELSILFRNVHMVEPNANHVPIDDVALLTPAPNNPVAVEGGGQTNQVVQIKQVNEEGNLPWNSVSGNVMLTVSSLPYFKYLLNNYIPVLPILKGGYIEEFFSKYEHSITTTLYSVGALTYGSFKDIGMFSRITSISAFFIKEPIYQYRADAHKYINGLEENWLMKFALYAITDVSISLVTFLPLVTFTQSNAVSIASSGLYLGAVNYYASLNKEGDAGKNVGFVITSLKLADCIKEVASQPDITTQIIAVNLCARELAQVHFFTKVATDFLVDGYNLMMGENVTNTIFHS